LGETGVPGENHRPVTSHGQTVSHNVVSSTPLHELTILVVKVTDCKCSCKSNYYASTIITTSTALRHFIVIIDIVLGPLLFLLYVNDLPLYLHETILELYADDTTIHTSNESVHIINNKFQNDLVQVKNWCKNNDIWL
jgi:hypothetical protein